MSSFSCPVVKIDGIIPHPDPETTRLEIVLIGGYRCVVEKGVHSVGDLVCYIPTESLLPESVSTALNLTGKLAGKKKNRVRAIKLRGEYSEGIVMPLAVLRSLIVTPEATWTPLEGFDAAGQLGVEKYEEEIPTHMQGVARPRPEWFPKYTDIENWKRYPTTFDAGEIVYVSEKIHGTNAGYGMHISDLEEMFVSSRNLVLEFDENNLYWQVGLEYDLPQILALLLERTDSDSVVIWGEIFGQGVQDLSYGRGKGFRWFDLMLNGKYVDHEVAANLIGDLLPAVPHIFKGYFGDVDLKELTDSNEEVSGSELHMKEGVVIRPLEERQARGLGRVILKYIGQQYELRKNGTERK